MLYFRTGLDDPGPFDQKWGPDPAVIKGGFRSRKGHSIITQVDHKGVIPTPIVDQRRFHRSNELIESRDFIVIRGHISADERVIRKVGRDFDFFWAMRRLNRA